MTLTMTFLFLNVETALETNITHRHCIYCCHEDLKFMSFHESSVSLSHLTSTGEKLRSALDLSTLSRAPAGGRWLGRGPGLYLNTRAGLDTGLCCRWGQGVTQVLWVSGEAPRCSGVSMSAVLQWAQWRHSGARTPAFLWRAEITSLWSER